MPPISFFAGLTKTQFSDLGARSHIRVLLPSCFPSRVESSANFLERTFIRRRSTPGNAPSLYGRRDRVPPSMFNAINQVPRHPDWGYQFLPSRAREAVKNRDTGPPQCSVRELVQQSARQTKSGPPAVRSPVHVRQSARAQLLASGGSSYQTAGHLVGSACSINCQRRVKRLTHHPVLTGYCWRRSQLRLRTAPW